MRRGLVLLTWCIIGFCSVQVAPVEILRKKASEEDSLQHWNRPSIYLKRPEEFYSGEKSHHVRSKSDQESQTQEQSSSVSSFSNERELQGSKSSISEGQEDSSSSGSKNVYTHRGEESKQRKLTDISIDGEVVSGSSLSFMNVHQNECQNEGRFYSDMTSDSKLNQSKTYHQHGQEDHRKILTDPQRIASDSRESYAQGQQSPYQFLIVQAPSSSVVHENPRLEITHAQQIQGPREREPNSNGDHIIVKRAGTQIANQDHQETLLQMYMQQDQKDYRGRVPDSTEDAEKTYVQGQTDPSMTTFEFDPSTSSTSLLVGVQNEPEVILVDSAHGQDQSLAFLPQAELEPIKEISNTYTCNTNPTVNDDDNDNNENDDNDEIAATEKDTDAIFINHPSNLQEELKSDKDCHTNIQKEPSSLHEQDTTEKDAYAKHHQHSPVIIIKEHVRTHKEKCEETIEEVLMDDFKEMPLVILSDEEVKYGNIIIGSRSKATDCSDKGENDTTYQKRDTKHQEANYQPPTMRLKVTMHDIGGTFVPEKQDALVNEEEDFDHVSLIKEQHPDESMLVNDEGLDDFMPLQQPDDFVLITEDGADDIKVINVQDVNDLLGIDEECLETKKKEPLVTIKEQEEDDDVLVITEETVGELLTMIGKMKNDGVAIVDPRHSLCMKDNVAKVLVDDEESPSDVMMLDWEKYDDAKVMEDETGINTMVSKKKKRNDDIKIEKETDVVMLDTELEEVIDEKIPCDILIEEMPADIILIEQKPHDTGTVFFEETPDDIIVLAEEKPTNYVPIQEKFTEVVLIEEALPDIVLTEEKADDIVLCGENPLDILLIDEKEIPADIVCTKISGTHNDMIEQARRVEPTNKVIVIEDHPLGFEGCSFEGHDLGTLKNEEAILLDGEIVKGVDGFKDDSITVIKTEHSPVESPEQNAEEYNSQLTEPLFIEGSHTNPYSSTEHGGCAIVNKEIEHKVPMYNSKLNVDYSPDSKYWLGTESSLHPIYSHESVPPVLKYGSYGINNYPAVIPYKESEAKPLHYTDAAKASNKHLYTYKDTAEELPAYTANSKYFMPPEAKHDIYENSDKMDEHYKYPGIKELMFGIPYDPNHDTSGYAFNNARKRGNYNGYKRARPAEGFPGIGRPDSENTFQNLEYQKPKTLWDNADFTDHGEASLDYYMTPNREGRRSRWRSPRLAMDGNMNYPTIASKHDRYPGLNTHFK